MATITVEMGLLRVKLAVSQSQALALLALLRPRGARHAAVEKAPTRPPTLVERIEGALAGGPMTLREIAEALGVPNTAAELNILSATANYAARTGRLRRVERSNGYHPTVWALADDREEQPCTGTSGRL